MTPPRGSSGVEDRPPHELPDTTLITSARTGDDVAFGVLVQRYAEVAFRAAYVVLGDADAAADAAQEGFISVHRSLSRFRTDEPFRPWLLRIVGNRARNLRRGAGRRAAATLQAASVAAVHGEVAASPEELLAADEERARVLAAVNGLAAEDRAVIACRYFLDLSEAETADLLGVARGTVKSRLSRARDRLRARLAGAEDSTDG